MSTLLFSCVSEPRPCRLPNRLQINPLAISIEDSSVLRLLTGYAMQVKAAEDILTLTREMKEMWLFGKLDTLGENDRDVETREKLEGDVKAVAAGLDRSIKGSGVS